jgi:hypothetical protein
MPRSSCDHHALPPSEPPDGVRRCSLEGSVSRSSLPATSPPESLRSWWCRRSYLLLAAVGGTQSRGGWCSSAIIRLQGFSSRSPVATSGRWSSTRMTTSLVVERSEPGCGLPPILSFKDVHHPRWGGGRAELGPCPPHGLATRFFLQHSREKGVRQPCEGGELRVRGAGRLRRRQLPRVWLLGLGGFGAASGAASCRLDGAWLSVHRMGDGRAVRGSGTSTASPASSVALGVIQDVVCRGGGVRVLGWSCPHSCSEDGSEDLFARAGAAAIRRYGTGAQVAAVVDAGEAAHCRGGCLRWRDRQCHLLPDLRLFGFNGLVVAPPPPVGRRG